MAHPSQNPRRYIHFNDPDDESEISSIAFQLAAASAADQQRHGGAPTQTQSPGHPSHLSFSGHSHHRHPHHNHPDMLSTLIATPSLPAGYFNPPTLNSSLASAIVAAEFQRQREATSAAQFAAARMSGMQPYIMGFSNYAQHAPPPSSATAYHQQPPQAQPQMNAFSGMEALVGGVSSLSPESSLFAVAHSATSTQATSSSSAMPSSNPVTAKLISTTAAATLPAAAASAAEDRTTVTASTSANNKSNNTGSQTNVSTVGPNRPLLTTPKWSGATTPLGVDEDKYYLSELQCVLRKEFVEAFGTTQSDTVLFINGRNKTIVIGQVGIRCKHCASISSNITTGDRNQSNVQQHAVLYPSCIGAIYNIVQQMYRLHFEQCPFIPDALKSRVANLRDSHTSNRGGRKQYWIDSAKRIGLIDTLFGIHFGRDPKVPLPPLGGGGGEAVSKINITRMVGGDAFNMFTNMEFGHLLLNHQSKDQPSLDSGDTRTQNLSAPAVDDVELYPLVTSDEKHLVADYLFFALEQMQPCNLMDSDRIGCYKGRRTGFPGLACKHCVGQAGCGRYFPASEASLSQTTTSQTIINHVRNCRRCPVEVRKQLELMRRAKHCPTYKKTDKPKHGGRKVFFRRLWCRIQRIPLPPPDTTGSDDTEKDFASSSSESLEKKKRKIRANSCEKDKRKTAKWSLAYRKAGHDDDDRSDNTIEHDYFYKVDGATFSPDRTGKTEAIRTISKTIAYQGRLARGDDSCWLSEADCFIRQEIVEVFTAQDEDLKLNGDLEIGQVGVRCFFCAENKSPQDREKGHAYYPSVVAAIQQSVSDLQTRHISDCSEVPDEVRMSLQSMQNHETKHLGDTAQYWIDAAKELGLHDSHEGRGIYFFRNPLEDSPADEIDIEKNDKKFSESGLVPKENRAKCTDLMLLLLKQFEPCQFNKSDRKSSCNRDRTLGYPGIGCIYCKVKRYFPLTEKKLQDSLSLMTTHIENCFHAPLEVKASLCYLQHRSLMQKYKLAGQWKFAFIKGVWNRLHQNYRTKDCNADSDTEAAAITSDDRVKGLDGKGRSTLWRREKAVIASKVDSIAIVSRENLNQICNNSKNNSNNKEGQEPHHSLTEMGHLIKAAALWLSERDAENDARALCGGGNSKGIKKSSVWERRQKLFRQGGDENSPKLVMHVLPDQQQQPKHKTPVRAVTVSQSARAKKAKPKPGVKERSQARQRQSMAMMSPEGEFIGRGWRIGKMLGSGACGSVHELTAPQGASSAWAVKVAPLPKSASSSKGKKRKKTPLERNADLIHHEYTILQNAGSEIRGKLVPEISFMGDPPAYGETEDKKFRFLVMERMQSPLSEVIPLLLESNANSRGVKKIPMGDVAIAMLNCIQAMHEKGNLFVDVKPENFMLSRTSAAASKRSKTDVSQRVRLIDFGLVERFNDMAACKHRDDAYPVAPLVGTPTYASLNIMSGHTASLRDDMEALGYVICELILMMASTGMISRGSGVGKCKRKDDDSLPWSNEASDEDLLRIKSQEMDKSKRSKSTLFARLKAAGADAVMDNYFSSVTGLAYSEKPDYISLRRNLEKLVVAVESSCTLVEAKNTKKKAPKSPVRKASARDVQTMLDDDYSVDSLKVIDENTENCKPASDKRQKRSAKVSTKVRNVTGTHKPPTTRDVGTQSDAIEVIDVDSVEDDDDAMDCDPLESGTRSGSKNKSIDRRLILDIIEGPHKGQVIPFGGNRPGTVCVGRDPAFRAMKDVIKLALSNDANVSPVHVKFALNSKATVHSVRVTDMSSTSGTVINGSSLPSGKSKQVFVGDKIKIGGTLIQIRIA